MAITTAVVMASQGNSRTRSAATVSSGFPHSAGAATTAVVIKGGCTAAVNKPLRRTSRAAARQPSAMPAGSR